MSVSQADSLAAAGARGQRLFQVLSTLALFVLAFPGVGRAVQVGLDPSYEFAFSYFLGHGIQLGRDAYYTYGPLGYMAFGVPVGQTLGQAMAFMAVLHLVFVGLLVRYFAVSAPAIGWGARAGAFAAMALIAIVTPTSAHTAVGNTLVMVTMLSLLLTRQTGRSAYFLGAVFATAVGLLAKVTWGVFCLAPTALYAAYTLLRDRRATPLAMLLVGLPLLEAGMWWLLYRNFDGWLGYLVGSLQFTLGYSAAMATPAEPNYWLLGLFWASLLAIPLALKNRAVWFAFGLFGLLIVGQWKYGATRIDHLYTFVISLGLFYAILLPLFARRQRAIGMALAGLSLGLLVLNALGMKVSLAKVGDRLGHTLAEPGRTFWTQVVEFPAHARALEAASSAATRQARLPEAQRRLIGGATIDTYPWEASYVYANQLNWTPRPIFQSYATYTPWLDQQNAAFFAAPRAPEFLLWHTAVPGNFIASIDGRYLPSDEPMTFRQIVDGYAPVGRFGETLLFKKAPASQLQPARLSPSETHAWGQWIEVPGGDADAIVRACIDIEPPALNTVRALFLGETYYQIEYRFEDLTSAQHRLVAANARHGVWIHPYLKDFDAATNRFVAKRPRAVRFTRTDTATPRPLTLRWETLRRRDAAPMATLMREVVPKALVASRPLPPVSSQAHAALDFLRGEAPIFSVEGWAFARSTPAARQALSLVLQSDRASYVVAMPKKNARPDVAEAYQLPDAVQSGYQGLFDTSGLPAGTYALGLLIEGSAGPAFVRTDKTLQVP